MCEPFCAFKSKIPHISITYWSSSVEFQIIVYYDPDWLWYACSQDTDPSFHLPISTFLAPCDYNPPTLQTDGRTCHRHIKNSIRHKSLCQSSPCPLTTALQQLHGPVFLRPLTIVHPYRVEHLKSHFIAQFTISLHPHLATW